MHHTARGLCLSCKLHTHTCASRIICICIFLEHIVCSFRIMYMWSTTSLVDINKFWLGTITVQLSHLSWYCVIIKQRGWREEGEINDILVCTVFQELEFHWFKAPRWLGKGGGAGLLGVIGFSLCSGAVWQSSNSIPYSNDPCSKQTHLQCWDGV